MVASSSRLKAWGAAGILIVLLVAGSVALLLGNQDRLARQLHDDAVTAPSIHQEWEN